MRDFDTIDSELGLLRRFATCPLCEVVIDCPDTPIMSAEARKLGCLNS